MNKFARWFAGFAACGGAAFAMTVAAQTAPPTTRTPTVTPAAAQKAAPDAQHARNATQRDNPFCLRDTGSRIKPPPGHCLPVAGRSYSRQDIDRTGATNIGQALQMLDPSVSVGH